MTSEEKILRVVEKIKSKTDISPVGAELFYYAGREGTGVSTEDEIMILNKISQENLIEVTGNYSSEYI